MLNNRSVFFSIASLACLLLVIICAEAFGLWGALGIPRDQKWFIDFHALVAAAECEAQGMNIYSTNPCDMYGRRHVYSPAWFLLDDIGITIGNQFFWSLLVSASFVICTLLITRPNTLFEFIVITGLLISPAVLLGIERANNDLIVFCLLALVCCLLCSKHTIQQLFAYLTLSLSAVLKFYPLVVFCVYIITAKSNKLFWAITVVTTLITASLIALTFTDLQQLTIPTPSNRFTFGSNYILQIPFPTLPFFKITIACWGLLFLLTFVLSKPVQTTDLQATNKTLLFITGSSVSLFAFITANNYDYRCVFLLFCLPLLFSQIQKSIQRKSAITTIILIMLVCWWELVTQTTIYVIGSDHRQYFAYYLVRWLEQPITWALMITLLWMLMHIIKAPLLARFNYKRSL